MKRIQRSLLTAAILFGGGIGIGAYVMKTEVKTADQRYLEKERGKRLFPEEFGLIHVKSGELIVRGTTIAFSLDDEGWRITSPVAWRGDRQAIDAAINQMVGVQVEPEARIEKPDDQQLETWGLLRPPTRMTVETEHGEFELLVGPKNAIQDMYPITDGKRRIAGLSTPEFYWALDRPLADYRDRRVFPLAPDEIQRVVRTDFRLERTDDGFILADPDGNNPERADLDRAELFLVALTKRLRIGRFLTDDYSEKDTSQHGIDPNNIVEVTARSGERMIAHVGKVIETGDQQGTAVMHLVGTKTVVEVPDFMHEEMAKTRGDLKDRTILRYERKKVAKIEMHYGRERMIVEKRGDDWRITAPVEKFAKGYRIDDIVRVFGVLKVDRFHRQEASKAELAEWLLDPPSRRFIFFDTAGKSLGDVRLGNLYSEEEMFAKNSAEPRIGLMKVDRIRFLPNELKDLIDPDREK